MHYALKQGVIMGRIDRELNQVFAERLRRARGHFTQPEVCEEMNMNITQYSHMENGHRLPSAVNLVKLSKTLGVSTDYLLGL